MKKKQSVFVLLLVTIALFTAFSIYCYLTNIEQNKNITISQHK